MTIAAPAKINLHLAVLANGRQDGFHNIESLFAAVNFEDFLHFELNSGQIPPFRLIIDGPAAGELDIPAKKNIIFKAFSLFKEKCQYAKPGTLQNLQVRLEKNIPLCGGLGGGSSDAASALMGFNKLAGSPLSAKALLELGAELGSDVPFFLHQTAAARVTGRGENIEPVEIPPWHFVLVNPGFKSDTARAYRLLDEFRGQGAGGREQGTVHLSGSLSFLYQSKIANTNPQNLAPSTHSLFYNDFLPVFSEPEKSTYNRILSQLWGYGAEFANLSGSGSTCFGAFLNKEQAEIAAISLKNDWNFVQLCSLKNFN